MDTDVLVVGAGPTGLMLANQLARRGTRALVVDRNAGPVRETRALGVQARTLEIYRHLGFVDRAIALGNCAKGANMWSRGKRRAWVPFSDIGTGRTAYPYVLILGQDDNEKLLGESLRERGGGVEWNTELVGLRPQPDRVIATLREAKGTMRDVAARWVAGCDGARSAVRNFCGIEFQGAPYEHVFYVADTKMSGPMTPNELHVYLWRGGFHLFFPLRGVDHWRIVGILPEALWHRDDLTLDEVMPSIRREAGADLDLRECTWFSTYRIHHRRAARFRSGRCFVLGDAAHVHSPVGAQGMNTGLQDAYNLAWKLALVVGGEAGEELLDTYAAEREPVATHLLSTTDRFFSLAVGEGLATALFRTMVLPNLLAFAMRFDRLQAAGFRTISQIGIRYRRSALSEEMPGLGDGGPRAGDRFPWMKLRLSANGAPEDLFARLDDTRFTLLLFGQPASASPDGGLGARLETIVVADSPDNEAVRNAAGIPRTAFYLLRPDGYVGLCGTTFERAALARYLADRVRAAARSSAA